MLKLLSRYSGVPPHHLSIAEGGVFEHPTGVHTVLGSCVAVTFHCPHTHISAVFHALLPRRSDFAKKGVSDTPYRYVDSGIEALLRDLGKLGVNKHRLSCKVFGGANAMFFNNTRMSMGMKNVESAVQTLAAHRIRISKSNVGGKRGRKILFVTSTNEVFVKFVGEDIPGEEELSYEIGNSRSNTGD